MEKEKEIDSEIVFSLKKKREMPQPSQPVLNASVPDMEDGRWKEFLKAVKDQVAESVREAVTDIKKGVEKDTTEILASVTRVESKVSDVQANSQGLQDELNKTKTELKMCRLQLHEVIRVVSRQDQIINKCKDKIETLQNHVNRDTLRITGIKEVEKEDTKEVVKNFFKEKLGIKEEIQLNAVYRVGKGDGRTVVVKLSKVNEKGLIFKNATKLKGVKNEYYKHYNIFDQLTAKKAAEKNWERRLYGDNKKKTVDKLKMSFEKSS